MPILSPAYDNKIAKKYSARTVEHKSANKSALQEDLGWINEPRQPIICFPTGSSDALGGHLLASVMEGLLEVNVHIVIRGRGSQKYGELFTTLSSTHSHRIAIIQDDDRMFRRMLAGSDMALFFAEKDEDEERNNALRYGTIPLSMHAPGLVNYNPIQESGNAFVFEKPTHWQCFAAVVRALETFQFPYDWRTIQRHAMDAMEKSSSSELEGKG